MGAKRQGVIFLSVIAMVLFVCGLLFVVSAKTYLEISIPTVLPTIPPAVTTPTVAPSSTATATAVPSVTKAIRQTQTSTATQTPSPTPTATEKPGVVQKSTSVPAKPATSLPAPDRSCPAALGKRRTLHFGESIDVVCESIRGTTMLELEVPDGRSTIVALVLGQNGSARGMELAGLAPEQYSSCISHWWENGSDCKRKFDEVSKPHGNTLPGQNDFVSVRVVSQQTREHGWLLLLINNLVQTQTVRVHILATDNVCKIRKIVTGNPIDAQGWIICEGGVFDGG